jgi:hypothetical protein
VRDSVADGAFICVDVWIGERPGAIFDTLKQQFLFCVQKDFSGNFNIMEQNAKQPMREKLYMHPLQVVSPAERKMQLLNQLKNQ